ncbi:hypothetical protein THSYN_19995 [Candidatus Thiodictyon syntrophicum]|uniref:Uncharacterized protein n=1 Tax=Candidatus Thiodictyon syntrophicum TaxID=1166950 RepID=A0A2K8UBN1_9GAMM|nr:hypothetical protein THSYN_19995 [Candidatus Thiodictyon syntrophicum]
MGRCPLAVPDRPPASAGIVTPKSTADATHVALATISQCEIIVKRNGCVRARFSNRSTNIWQRACLRS